MKLLKIINELKKEEILVFKLIIEKEDLKEEKNGKVKEYYDNGNLRFEGEYLNGMRNGKGKEYNIYGQLIFEGEYLNGEKYSN